MLSSAALGGIAYWLAIFPVDVIKSSMQTDTIIKSKRRYTDMVTSAKVGMTVGRDVCVWGGVSRAAPTQSSSHSGATLTC